MSKLLTPVHTAYGYKVQFEGGGQVPNELSGLYTTADRAKFAINAYMSSKPKPKAKRKAHANSKDLDNKE